MKSRTSSGWLSRTATISAVCWNVLSRASSVAPRSSSTFTVSRLPTCAAIISGVSPAPSTAFGVGAAFEQQP